MKFEMEVRIPQLSPNEWNVGVILSSTQFRPYRIVVILAVEAQVVHPREMAREAGLFRQPRDRPANEPRHHRHFEPESGDVFQLIYGLRRSMHRHASGRGHPIRIVTKDIGVIAVKRATYGAAHLFVIDMGGEQTLGLTTVKPRPISSSRA
jgi:hypothetical protein